jgi:hypothetical protein
VLDAALQTYEQLEKELERLHEDVASRGLVVGS